MFVAVAIVLGLVSFSGVGSAQAVERACPPGEVPPNDFWDVSDTHARSVDCVAWWGITSGTGHPLLYGGDGMLTRAQMATFVANLVETLGGQLPEPAPTGFDDVEGSVHRSSIERLASAGIVSGVSDTAFDPDRAVPRDQMATMLVRAYEYVIDGSLPTSTGPFDDIDRSPHRENIVKAHAAGLAAGTSDTTFSPSRTVTREQVASFVSRVLGAGVAELGIDRPAPSPARFSGDGDAVVRVGAPGDRPMLLLATHDGSSNFVVWTRDPDNERVSLLVNVVGGYDGMVAANLGRHPEPARAFEVTADGAWTLRFLPLERARAIPAEGARGMGDEVIEVSALAGSDLRITHDGASNVAVWAYDDDGRSLALLVNHIGEYDGVKVLPNQARWLEVTADGDWTLAPS